MGFGFNPHSLQQILDNPLGFWHYEFEAPEAMLNVDLAGDWTIRKDTPREDLLKALEPIILKATGRKIHIHKTKHGARCDCGAWNSKGFELADSGANLRREIKSPGRRLTGAA